MKHPLEYTTEPFGALRVMTVDAGAVITDERSGQSITVDDETVAVKGAVMFCTEKTTQKLRDASVQLEGGAS